MSTPAPGQVLRDNNTSFVLGDQRGIWIADANTGGVPFVCRYSLDSGRWLQIPLLGAIGTFLPHRSMAIDSANNKLYVLLCDAGATQTTQLFVIDTTPVGDVSLGNVAITGIVNTFTVTDNAGGLFNQTPVSLLFDASSSTLWTFSYRTASNSHEGFYKIDPTTGLTTYFDIIPTVFSSFGVSDVYADGGFLYYADHANQGYLFQFLISGGVIDGSAGVSLQVWPGSPNAGLLVGFDTDPTNGHIVALCSSSEPSNFGNTSGYIVIDPTTLTVVGQASSTFVGIGLSVDSSGNVWFVEKTGSLHTFKKYVSNTLSVTKTALPSAFVQNNPYGFAWAQHLNGNPSLFTTDTTGTPGTLYAGNDSNTEPLFAMNNTVNAPDTRHVDPMIVVADQGHAAYPTNDANGLWVGCSSKVVRYSPEASGVRFSIIPLEYGTTIATNGVTLDAANNRLYVLDQTNSYIWVIDTTATGSPITGFAGIVKFLDLTSTWPAGSATFGGLAFNSGTNSLFITDGTNVIYKVDASTGAVTTTTEPHTPAKAIFAAGSFVLWNGTPGVTYYNDLINPTTLATAFSFNNAAFQIAAGIGADGTNFYVANQAGKVNVVALDGSGSNNFNPSTVNFGGDSLTLQGTGGGSSLSAWVALRDVTTSINYIVNYAANGSAANFTKVLPAPFAFGSSGAYGQGSYGVAWLASTINKIFISDVPSKKIWSGAANNSAMAVETTFPYPTSFNGAMTAGLVANSILTADLSLLASTAAITADSSLAASIIVTRRLLAMLTSDSSVSSSLTDTQFLTGTFTCSSTLLGNLTVRDQESMFALADSHCTASILLHYTIAASPTSSGVLTANLTEFFRRHAFASVHGGSDAHGTLRLAASHQNFNQGPESKALRGSSASGSKQPQNAIPIKITHRG